MSLIGEAIGGVLVYGLLHVFVFTRCDPTGDRVFTGVVVLGLLAGMIAAAFY